MKEGSTEVSPACTRWLVCVTVGTWPCLGLGHSSLGCLWSRHGALLAGPGLRGSVRDLHRSRPAVLFPGHVSCTLPEILHTLGIFRKFTKKECCK